MYNIHPTHGAGARPSEAQAPTATRLTTFNADQCVHQPKEGRGRIRQTPPPQKRGGGTRKAHSHKTAHPHHKRRPNPPARRHRRQDPPKKHWRTTQPKPATPNKEQRPIRREDTPNTPTHTSLGRRRAKKKKRRRSLNQRGRGDGDHESQDRDSQRRTPQSHNTTRHDTPPEKKTQRGGGRQIPLTATPPHPHATGGPLGADGKRTRRTQKATRPSTQARKKRGTRTNTHTPQQPNQEWRGRAET